MKKPTSNTTPPSRPLPMDSLASTGSAQTPEGLYLQRIDQGRRGQDLRQALKFEANPMESFNTPMSNPFAQGSTVGEQREAVFGEASGGHQDLRDVRSQTGSGSGGMSIFSRKKKAGAEKQHRSILARRIGK